MSVILFPRRQPQRRYPSALANPLEGQEPATPEQFARVTEWMKRRAAEKWRRECAERRGTSR